LKKLSFVLTVIFVLGIVESIFSQNSESNREILYPREPFSHYQIIVERNPFEPRGELAGSILSGKVLPKLTLPHLYLTGIVYDGKQSLAIIEDRKEKSEDFFAEGDTISEAKILEISEKKQLVVLEYQGEEMVLSLSPAEKPKKSFAPPVTLPSASEAPLEILPRPIKSKKSLFPIRERLGMQIREISPELTKRLKLPSEKGLYVLVVNKNSPAGFANLSGGDIVTGINGSPVTTVQGAQQALENVSAGSEVTLEVIKKGRDKEEIITFKILKE